MAEYYPPTGFYFTVRIAGMTDDNDAAFSEASGISAEMSTEEIAEGGENRFKHRVPTAMQYSNLVLKRGLVVPSSALAKWCMQTLSNDLSETIQPKTIVLLLLDPEGKELASWNFVNAWPVKMNISEFKSDEAKVVMETVEFSYQYFQRMK